MANIADASSKTTGGTAGHVLYITAHVRHENGQANP